MKLLITQKPCKTALQQLLGYLSSMFTTQLEYWDVKGRDTEEFLQNLI